MPRGETSMSGLVFCSLLALAMSGCGDDTPPDPDSSTTVDSGVDRDTSVDEGGDSAADSRVNPDSRVADSSTTADTGGPVDFGSTIGAVGCSNSNQAVMGYLEVSTVDAMINTAQGGQAMREWLVPTGGPWTRYEANRPAGGFSAVWLNLCQRASDGLDQSVVDTVIGHIRSRDPDAPIIISPLNFYEEETCGVTNGNEIPNAGATLSDNTAAADPTVFRGPDLGPFGAGMLRMDNCHLNAAGITRAGEQLSAFFDG